MWYVANTRIADDKDNKLMSSSGLEASEQDMQDVLQEFDGDAGNETAFGPVV